MLMKIMLIETMLIKSMLIEIMLIEIMLIKIMLIKIMLIKIIFDCTGVHAQYTLGRRSTISKYRWTTISKHFRAARGQFPL